MGAQPKHTCQGEALKPQDNSKEVINTKTERIKFWLSGKDLRRLDRLAGKLSLTRSECIRQLLGGCKLIRTPSIDYDKYYAEFKPLGDELDRYIHGFRATGILNEARIDAVCDQILALMQALEDEICDKLRAEIEKAKGHE